MKNRIADCRDELDLKQKEVAEKMGVDHRSLSGWENDTDHIPLNRLVFLCNEYDFSADYLFYLSNSNVKYTKIESIDAKVIGKRLKKVRRKLKLTQQQVADTCSIHNVTYSNYERGVNTITAYNLYLICKTYHVSMDAMLGRKRIK